jgi:hypothetical protein
MAQGNYYAPLYFSTSARGKMSPLSAPAAIRPYEKKKGLGEKAAGALGQMISDSMAPPKKPSTVERIARARIRDKELRAALQNEQSINQPPKVMQAPYVQVGTDANGNKVFGFPAGDEYKIPTRPLGQATPGPSLLEQEWFHNRAMLKNLEGGEKSSGFIDPKLNNQLIYHDYVAPTSRDGVPIYDDFTQSVDEKNDPIRSFISTISKMGLN